jgi:two-component system OmpR family response regulator
VKPLRRIVCVDDEEDILEVMKLSLELGGDLEIFCCTSGREALRRTPELQPDLVMLDVMMPQMDGPATLTGLRELPACGDVPVVFVTARLRESETAEYLKLGACGVIGKPFDPMTLGLEIANIWRALQERLVQKKVRT